MKENTSHLASLFTHATEGIILANSKGNIVLINPAAERMFRYESSELENKTNRNINSPAVYNSSCGFT